MPSYNDEKPYQWFRSMPISQKILLMGTSTFNTLQLCFKYCMDVLSGLRWPNCNLWSPMDLLLAISTTILSIYHHVLQSLLWKIHIGSMWWAKHPPWGLFMDQVPPWWWWASEDFSLPPFPSILVLQWISSYRHCKSNWDGWQGHTKLFCQYLPFQCDHVDFELGQNAEFYSTRLVQHLQDTFIEAIFLIALVYFLKL